MLSKSAIGLEIVRFRQACETLARTLDPDRDSFSRFPRGQCQITALLLAQHLADTLVAEYSRIEIVLNADVPKHGSHAWLEIDGNVVDITADQFHGHSVVVLEPLDDRYRSYGGERERLEKPPFEAGHPAIDRLNDIRAYIGSSVAG